MSEILYATGNAVKFRQAQEACSEFAITLQQTGLDVPEIQGEESLPIAWDKAEKAFTKFKQPVVISDDSWSIPGLNGFPGPYMKSVNEWFSVEDWLNLTNSLADRRIILQQIVIYQDASEQKLFSSGIEGVLLHEGRGRTPYPHCAITSFDGGKNSIGEFHERNESDTARFRNVWHEFAEWYQTKKDI